VCGHSECGAMKALLDPTSMEQMPTVQRWLANAHIALLDAKAIQRARRQRGEPEGDLLRIVTEQNVLLQMRHVHSHPSVAEAIARGKLRISGWVYDIAEGAVRINEDVGDRFEQVQP
jgi:carbonic anhydrase